MAYRLADNVASLYTVNTLTGYLVKYLGHKAPKAAVSDYLEWFEDAYFLFTVKIFDASLARANTNPKKAYCIDHALAVSVGSGILVNSGHLLENLVFTALRRTTEGIFYYRTKSGEEVDFLAQKNDRSRMLVQVCETLADPQIQEARSFQPRGGHGRTPPPGWNYRDQKRGRENRSRRWTYRGVAGLGVLLRTEISKTSGPTFQASGS